ncbi:MAG: Uma2 family endonuclease [Anaerolineae bacterium]|nr:Uma2 family endonuclease [Anaerolineae bacterium]
MKDDAMYEAVRPLELAVEVAQLWPPRGQWTEADYFALPDTNHFVELSEGELIMPPHPTHTHQLIVLELATRLRTFVQTRNLGIVQIGPLPVRLWPGKIREPDILFVAREHRDRIGEQVYGPPDLAVEVLSPHTRRTDRLEKTVEYARAGVMEYWIVDPHGQTVEVFVLREGAYELLGKWGRGEEALSEVLAGFRVVVDDVLGGIPAG